MKCFKITYYAILGLINITCDFIMAIQIMFSDQLHNIY